MTEQQVRVDSLLTVAKQQLDQVAATIEVLLALNRGNDLASYCEISNRGAVSLEATCSALLSAHNVCRSVAIGRLMAAQKGGLIH
jgi:hypothetical protein